MVLKLNYECYIVLTTIDDEEKASSMARRIIGEKLAACVSIIPRVKSIYLWRGSVEEASEYILLIKTVGSRLRELVEFLRREHTYELPEIIAVKVDSGLREYLEWVKNCVSS